MDGLQRSSISFRRQGSSGFVWDEKFLADEMNLLAKRNEDAAAAAAAAAADNSTTSDGTGAQPHEQELQVQQVKEELVVKVSSIERSRSNGGGLGFRTGKVSPAIEPPSPKVSACGFCSAFGKHDKNRRRAKPGKRKII